jgi:hypothetical protein
MVGLHTYSVISELRHLPSGADQDEILADGLRNILLDVGTLLGGWLFVRGGCEEVDGAGESGELADETP